MKVEFGIEIPKNVAYEVQEYILRKPQKFNQNQLGDFALSL